MHHAEMQCIKFFPDLIEASTSTQLTQNLTDYNNSCIAQIDCLEQVLEDNGLELDFKSLKSTSIAEGFLKEAGRVIKAGKASEVCNISIGKSVLNILQYKLINYAALLNIARMLKLENTTRLIEEISDAEQKAQGDFETTVNMLVAATVNW